MRYAVTIAAALLLAVSVAGPASAAPKPFKSKLGIHLLSSYSPGAREIIEADCPIITLFESGPAMMQAARDYKRFHPNGTVLLRYYIPVHYEITDDPAACAAKYWEQGLWPRLSKLSGADRKLIDYVEGPNECEMLCWKSPADGAWNSRYCETLIRLMAKEGFRACIGNIPVGNPASTPETEAQTIRAFIPALRLAKKMGGCWAYHAYTLKYTEDPKVEIFYSLRYRQFYRTLAKYAPDLKDMPMVLGEGGVDNDGSHNSDPGWKRGSAARYEEWLKWFDSEIRKDHYIKGVTLFEIGDPTGWPSFDLEPIAGWLANYLGH